MHDIIGFCPYPVQILPILVQILNQILPKFCPNPCPNPYPNPVQILSKSCPNPVQILSNKSYLNSVQICPNLVQILSKFCSNPFQILSRSLSKSVKILYQGLVAKQKLFVLWNTILCFQKIKLNKNTKNIIFPFYHEIFPRKVISSFY